MSVIAKYFSLLFFMLSIVMSAQVTFIIDDLPETTPIEDLIYIAGDFNGWDPGSPLFAMELNSQDKWEITLDAQSEGSVIEYKFTRGDWGTVEKGASGEEIFNRAFIFGNGDTVYIDILNWADIAGGSTAADNVFIVDEDFYMPQLDRNRKVWIYLPPEYDASPNNYYPVLYMHDGQNVFDVFTSFTGEWEVDETLNELAAGGTPVPIVVAIDNGGALRIDEYSPWYNTQFEAGGEGDDCINFIVETLKPFIDENYRTLPDRNSTGLMGSSLGGLISHYGAIEHQDVFSKAGIFSPSYWFSDTVWTFVQETGSQEAMRLYQMTGENEGGSQVPFTLAMHDSLLAVGFNESELNTIIIPNGFHNEQLWRSQFEDAYLWLFADYIATDVEKIQADKPINIYPNPVYNTLYISNIISNDKVSIEVIDVMGKVVFEIDNYHGVSLNVSGLIPGSYIIQLQSEKTVYYGRFIKH